jgi:hypothetical protein
MDAEVRSGFELRSVANVSVNTLACLRDRKGASIATPVSAILHQS